VPSSGVVLVAPATCAIHRAKKMGPSHVMLSSPRPVIASAKSAAFDGRREHETTWWHEKRGRKEEVSALCAQTLPQRGQSVQDFPRMGDCVCAYSQAAEVVIACESLNRAFRPSGRLAFRHSFPWSASCHRSCRLVLRPCHQRSPAAHDIADGLHISRRGTPCQKKVHGTVYEVGFPYLYPKTCLPSLPSLTYTMVTFSFLRLNDATRLYCYEKAD